MEETDTWQAFIGPVAFENRYAVNRRSIGLTIVETNH
jgi:hypothetical protein